MPTVPEYLAAAGWTPEDIAGFDKTKMAGIEQVLNKAESDRAAAELAQRASNEMFENTITPALNAWGNKEAGLTAERDYYKSLAEGAKAGGFIAEVPPFKPGETPRGPGGQFVPNANAVPGSPNLEEFQNKVGNALVSLSDLQWKYQSLHGTPMPDPPSVLAAEAAAQRMPLMDYAAKKYNFAGKEEERRATEQKKHDDAIRAEAVAETEKKYAEAGGANPAIRQARTSQYSELRKGVQEGTRVDPLKMTREQRHAATAQAIQQELASTAVH